jgi:hypothetical protein
LVRRERPSVLLVQSRTAGGRRDRAQKIAALVVLALAVGVALWAVMRGTQALGALLFSQNDRFTIRRVDVQSSGRMKPEMIRQFAGVAEGMNVFAISLDRMSGELLKVSRIRGAVATRRLPDTIILRVDEREPVAVFRSQPGASSFFAIDQDGYVFVPQAGGLASRLPELTNLRIPGVTPGHVLNDGRIASALDLIHLCEDPGIGRYVRPVEIDVGAADALAVRFEGGREAVLPRDRIKGQVETMINFLVQSPDRFPAGHRIDLTGDRNYPVVPVER